MAKIICNFISYSLRRTVDITVVVPTPTIPDAGRMARGQGECRHTPKAPYPVLYLLHGMGNNHATWNGYTNVELYAEERQIVVVCPSGENKGYIPNGADDFFRFISEELPDFICGIFPVSKRPEDTYLAGLSMGGYGALVHGLSHPERFAAVGAFSAGGAIPSPEWIAKPDQLRQAVQDGSILHQKDGVPVKYDAFALKAAADYLESPARANPKFYLACGDADSVYERATKYRDFLRSVGADVTWDEMQGLGHEWRFWDAEVEKFLDWIPRTDPYAKEGRRRV